GVLEGSLSSQERTLAVLPDVLESLSSQERTLAVLLEQAFRIKEEVSAGLQSAQGSVQVEALSRKLLENHILTITRIVKQLSMDIQALERQTALRDSITSGTTMAVQSLEQKNVAGIGDLRGRVARYAHQAWVKQCMQTLRYCKACILSDSSSHSHNFQSVVASPLTLPQTHTCAH
uniref:Family with sequence similarity 81 member B n=1 Tax=Sander lucioperca TaxID=283035 RepID=A0A8C9X5K6_SANLU